VQGAVSDLLKSHGLDISVLSCCIVNQNNLAIDAREPISLVHSMEKLLGTWEIRKKIEQTDADLAEALSRHADQVKEANTLAAVRLELRPEVVKLLEGDRLWQQTQTDIASHLESVVSKSCRALEALRRHVRCIKCSHAG
jgi:hypothetical protein